MGKTTKPNRSSEGIVLKSSLSLSTVLIILITVLILIVATLLILRPTGVSGFALPWQKKVDQLALFQSKLDNPANLGLDQTYRLTVTEQDFSSLIGADKPGFFLKNSKVVIDSAGLHLSGKVGNALIGIKTEILILPVVTDGVIKYEVKSIKSGDLPAPNKVVELVNSSLAPALDKASADLNSKITIENITLGQGQFVISGSKK